MQADRILQKEAAAFVEHNLRRGYTIGMVKEIIGKKLNDFSTDTRKHRFLVLLKKELLEEYKRHPETCPSPETCKHDEAHERKMLVLDDELEYMTRYMQPETPGDNFTPTEQMEISIKIDNVIRHFSERFDKLDYGQEALFEELQDLKQRFNLGKKGFGQMLAGKVVEMVGSSIIDKAVGNEIYSGVMQGIKEVKGFLK